MKPVQPLSILLLGIVLLILPATLLPLLNNAAGGPATHTSVRGETVTLYRIGPYRHMPADVAIQGIAQDYITLLVALPLLVWGWRQRRRLYAQVLLAGVLLYFVLTYLFYLNLAMYNELFLVYVGLLGCSAFALLLHLLSFPWLRVSQQIERMHTLRWLSVFLIANALLMTLLWLQVLVPPLVNGSLYPKGLAHFTSLVVQGHDLALFLPMSALAGILALRSHPAGAAMAAIYIVFLALLMLALLAKVVAMARAGQNVVPVVFITPSLFAVATVFSLLLLNKLRKVTAG